MQKSSRIAGGTFDRNRGVRFAVGELRRLNSNRPIAQSFDLSEIRLADGPIKDRQERTHRYLLDLNADRLLHNFRSNAGLPSSAEPLGGWEAPDHGLRGHFVGHYLAACAMMYRALKTGDGWRLQETANQMVIELARCQQALGGEYLSAFSEADLDVIETRYEGAWASYYVLHKIVAGLLEVHRHCGNAQSLQMAIRLVAYIQKRIEKLSPDQLESMLRTDKPNPTNETGGWSETLNDLFTFTKDPDHLKLAQTFDREWFFAPLVNHEDKLAGLHCNTHIPMAMGAARRFDLTGDVRYRDAATFFWERTTLARSYVNGGSSGPRPDGLEKSKGGEHWPRAQKLANTLTPKINESCVTHNMMRLTDWLFRWTAESRYADFYERAYFNSVLCMQNPKEIGGYIYDHPLGSSSVKVFGHAHDTFWCCYGSTVEAFSRLAQGIYYHSNDTLWINLPIASTLTWRQMGLRITQKTDFPNQLASRITFDCDKPVRLTVNIRVPHWTGNRMIMSVNGGDEVPAGTISRTWSNGDRLEIRYSMNLRTESMPDDPSLIAFLYGPIVLAAKTNEPLILDAFDSVAAVSMVRPTPGGTLEFQTTLASGVKVSLVPVNEITDEQFGVYFRLRER